MATEVCGEVYQYPDRGWLVVDRGGEVLTLQFTDAAEFRRFLRDAERWGRKAGYLPKKAAPAVPGGEGNG